ncbi:F-box domain-containing protein [Caenorhabditis elegans]|uniref:F-box domain-containing protein n=1 Tax=Caenorhabditis elegans TaxID=6239 RepID=Q17896_CAEEL|nr:F-box domain-containing protein [Caenorhabditis elegans]CAA92443.2 F-box domain-containing protein [Caenorhabditis elegans]|eukprot:NP_501649.2 Uncharacterized protein CELE_C10C5.2 [Caenorhabditis elegans]
MSWPTLTVRLQQKVIRYLDYESRCNLRICSKDDKDSVDSVKFNPKTLMLYEITSDMSEEKTIVRMQIDTFKMWFIGKNNITKVDKSWNGELVDELSELKQENRYDVIRRYLTRMSLDGIIQAESIKLDDLSFSPPETLKFKCDNLEASYIGNNHDALWMKQFILEFKNLTIIKYHPHEDIGFTYSELKVSNSLNLNCDIGITDKDLLEIKATSLNISSQLITVEGAKKALERFLKRGKKTDTFVLEIRRPENFNAQEHIIPKSLVIRKIIRRGETEDEYYGKIFRGFENENGVQDVRDFNSSLMGDKLIVSCSVYEKSETPCQLYPFYYSYG